MSMARLWRDQGRRDEARDLLAPVYRWFTEDFDTRGADNRRTERSGLERARNRLRQALTALVVVLVAEVAVVEAA
jgi:hypothetical protein